MKGLANIVLGAGIVSLVIAVLLRLSVKPTVLGLEPSSFLGFSIACFALAIAMVVVLGKEGK
ncbi:MAG: hypothetical protein A3F87_02085 [Omnitrophica WOR_2 bacterium RIFCSPLOWO2_12_FULL_51_24]|nr:MAG: hypothetical protein A3I43_05245 [Omnitrophica WOR_2 bacterium RIFCSPLOWO2_02_FULL_50_19]OGX42765.1 MAG: hypothetical protein A3F87_02085 [Omnitrophica WOR_2 bacterium RIFCSPLOWO2_12_FULL_51_24]